MKISIIMLTHNAPIYVEHSIKTIRKFSRNFDSGGAEEISYELIVFDNNSDNKTKNKLKFLKEKGYIDKLIFSETNFYFAGGNNRAASYSDDSSKYLLLINSDIEIRNENWLSGILSVHKRGMTGCQVSSEIDLRPDGWCVMIDRDLFLKYRLNEERFVWFYSIADFGSRLMKDGYSVRSIRNYHNFIVHFGGASEIAPDILNRSRADKGNIDAWYPAKCEEIGYIDIGKASENLEGIFFKVYNRIKKRKISKCNKRFGK